MKKAFIFDLDGTLVESLPGIAASLNRALIGHGLRGHSDAEVRRFIGDGARMLVTRAMSAGEAAFHLESVLRYFSVDYDRSWDKGTFVYPGIIELLESLVAKGASMAVLSNKPDSFTQVIVNRLFPQIPFTVVLGNQDKLPHKPDPTGALQIATAMGFLPGNCVIIGDSTMDLDTAKNAGMSSIAVTWGYQDRERLSGATTLVNTVEELDLVLRTYL